MSRQSLIFSRAANNGILSTEAIAQRAPAVFADTKADRLTNRYQSLRTADLMPILADYGYFPTQAAQKRSRKAGGLTDHSAHMLAFSNTHDVDTSSDIRPEIILYNSHDGTSSVKMFAGAYRFICSNSIVAGDGFALTAYHSRKALSGFEDMVRTTVQNLPSMMDMIESMRQRQLCTDEQQLLATQAVSKRWKLFDHAVTDAMINGVDLRAGTYANTATIRSVCVAQRIEDVPSDAWTVWNRIQESVLRGNTFIKSVVNRDGEVLIRDRKARPVTSVSEHLRINKELFDLIAA